MIIGVDHSLNAEDSDDHGKMIQVENDVFVKMIMDLLMCMSAISYRSVLD